MKNEQGADYSHSRRRSVLVMGANPPSVVHRKLFDYLVNNQVVNEAVYIGHPLLESTSGLRCTEVIYLHDGKRIEVNVRRGNAILPFSAIQDVLVSFSLVISRCRRYDTSISVGLHLAFFAIVLERLRVVRQTVFWSIDYFPERFKNRFLNWVALKLDEFCSMQSDYVWTISESIAAHRRRRGVHIPEDRVFVVPVTFSSTEIKTLPIASRIPDSLVVAGNLNPLYGMDLVVDAMRLVVQHRANATVAVVSYTPVPLALRKRVSQAHLENNFRFLGYVNEETFEQVLLSHRVGLATYRPEFAETAKNFADPSRVKYYLSKGLPVIVTRSLFASAAIESNHAGLVVDYNPQQLADAILTLLSDDHLWEAYSENAIRLASTFKSETVYKQALSKIGLVSSRD